jgi:glycosyltransferase involved in cell wall biosynthesis
MIYADQRWIGDHGIGRVAREVLAGLDFRQIPLVSDPASPLDPMRLSHALRKLTRKDLFFSPGYNSPFFCAAPFVLTIHDLNHIDRPENSGPLKRLYYAKVIKRSCHRAAKVLTVSEFSRTRIIEWSGIPPEKVVNVGDGVGPEYSPAVEPYPLPFPYLLCVSNRRAHKNEFRTVQAFAQADLAADIRLVFTGLPSAELAACIEQCKLTARVHFAGRVPEANLPSLYRSAEALVFVSLYEGFGLPVIEAMACGTPVVTSNTTSLPEVAGDAALLVDPTSVEQLAAVIQRVVGDAPLRQSLREKGLQRAAQFPWSTTALKVQKLLLELAPEGTRADFP